MFEYIKLKNFKSFKDIELNLLDKYNNPKKLILIYGKNGIGKSNLVSSFSMLSETLRTMDVHDVMEAILSENINNIENKERLQKIFKYKHKDLETIIKENKAIFSDEPMLIEFGFNIDKNKGKYLLETNNHNIIHERLEFLITKRKGIYFDITPSNISINEKIFLDKFSYQSVKDSTEKFWGKHSFLSILMHEINDKSDYFLKNIFSDNFIDFIKFVTTVSSKIESGNVPEKNSFRLPPEILSDYARGYIDISQERKLYKSQKMLTNFLKLVDDSIVKAYYKKNRNGNAILYDLMLSKNISGKIIDINSSLEATGTQSIIKELPFILSSITDSVSVIDDFDACIHDMLAKDLITSLYTNLKGQLILTTHNTLLMEGNYIPKNSIYVINELDNGNKDVQCILRYDNKIGITTNVRKQYLSGKYRGIPASVNIDFSDLFDMLK